VNNLLVPARQLVFSVAVIIGMLGMGVTAVVAGMLTVTLPGGDGVMVGTITVFVDVSVEAAAGEASSSCAGSKGAVNSADNHASSEPLPGSLSWYQSPLADFPITITSVPRLRLPAFS
jgi:hypothetical protein